MRESERRGGGEREKREREECVERRREREREKREREREEREDTLPISTGPASYVLVPLRRSPARTRLPTTGWVRLITTIYDCTDVAFDHHYL